MAINADKNTEPKDKSRIRFVPLFFVFTYPILVALDIFTTYLATPDLGYELNPITVKIYSSSKWIGIIIWMFCVVLFNLVTVLLTNKTLTSNLMKNISNTRRIWKWTIIVIHVLFIGHYVGSTHAFITNYLSYIYLNGTDNVFLKILVQKNVEYTNLLTPFPCYLIFNTMLYILGLGIFVLRCQYLKRKLSPLYTLG